jgi:hypothetical protein
MGIRLRKTQDPSHPITDMWYAPTTSFLDNLFQGTPGKAPEVFSQNTNVHPAFGVVPKIERNKKLVNSVYRQTQGYMLIGDRTQETMSDPLHRPPRYILEQFRINSSGLGRDRALIRAAAPQQVTWKNAYWRVQKPPYRTPIGPYTHGQMQSQSVLYRINMWLRGQNSQQG